MDEHPPRNLGLDLVRVTEAAALAAGMGGPSPGYLLSLHR